MLWHGIHNPCAIYLTAIASVVRAD